MQITVTLSGDALSEYIRALETLGPRARVELGRGLSDGGKLVLTQVRRSLRTQMGVKRYGSIVAHTRGFLDAGALTYTIAGMGKGLPIEDFPVRYSRSSKTGDRWSPRLHWKVQPRDASGRFGKIGDVSEEGGVWSAPWGAGRVFARSFKDSKGRARATRPDGRTLRVLYGPSTAKEIVKDQALSTFHASVQTIVEPSILRRITRLMP